MENYQKSLVTASGRIICLRCTALSKCTRLQCGRPAMKGAHILIVDACRDDPFGRHFRSNSRRLAMKDAPQGTLIAYATAPDSVMADGTGLNSPFTKHLARS